MVNITSEEQIQSICPVFDILHSIIQTRAAIVLDEGVGLGNNGHMRELSINMNGDMREGWMDTSEMATNEEIEVECTFSAEDAPLSGTDTGVSASRIGGLGMMAVGTSGKDAAIAHGKDSGTPS